MLENDFSFSCPYCAETLSIRLDLTGGKKQEFVYDCEVCCRPIHLQITIEGGEVTDFSAEPEDH